MKTIPIRDFGQLFKTLAKFNLFAGSGISNDSGLPGKVDFINKFLEVLVGYSDIIRRKPEVYLEPITGRDGKSKEMWMERFIEILNMHSTSFGRDRLAWDLLQIYREGEPNFIHNVIAKEFRNRIAIIFTTNFDTLLERAYNNNERSVIPTIPNKEPGDGDLIKLHGCINDTNGLVVTPAGIARQLYPESLYSLQSEMSNRPTVFMGYGGRDPDICSALLLNGFGPYEIYYCVLEETELSNNRFFVRLAARHKAVFVIGDIRELFETSYGPPNIAPQSGNIYLQHIKTVLDNVKPDRFFVEHFFLTLYEQIDLHDLIEPLFHEVTEKNKETAMEIPPTSLIGNKLLYARYLRNKDAFFEAERVYSEVIRYDLMLLRQLDDSGSRRIIECGYYLHKGARAGNVGMMMNILKLSNQNFFGKMRILLYPFFYWRALSELYKCRDYMEKQNLLGPLSIMILRINDIKFRIFMHLEDNFYKYVEKIPLLKVLVINKRLGDIKRIRKEYLKGLSIAKSHGEPQTSSHFFRKLVQANTYKYRLIGSLNKVSLNRRISFERKKINAYILEALETFDLVARRSAIGYTACVAARYLMVLKEYRKAWDLIRLSQRKELPREEVTNYDIRKIKGVLEKKGYELPIDIGEDFDTLFNKVLSYFE